MTTVNVNGTKHAVETDPRRPLLDVLREDLNLRGSKHGCGEGECGACTVIVNGAPVCACLVLAGSVEGAEVTTIEGMDNDPVGTEIVRNMANAGAVQCGFCIPGFVMQGWDAVQRASGKDPETLRAELGGNLCRCTGYAKILEALQTTAATRPVSPIRARRPDPVPDLRLNGYLRPATMDALRDALRDPGEKLRVIAGGTDLMVQNRHGLETLTLLDLSGLTELTRIDSFDDRIEIGAGASWTDIRENAQIREHAPVLALAAAEVGARQIQNRATIGGNLANASPAADGVPPLAIYDAQVLCLSAKGERAVPIQAFITGPGKTCLEPGEIIRAVSVPVEHDRQDTVAFFEKSGPRKAQTISRASVACHIWTASDGTRAVRIAIGAVAPTVRRVPEAEALLRETPDAIEAAADLVRQAALPISDIRASADYRMDLVQGLFKRGFLRATQA